MKKHYTDYLKRLKNEADKAYEAGTPIMEDDAYDSIFGESSTVGVKNGDVPHTFAMYSLSKYYIEDGEAPLPEYVKVETPKLDGCAVSLLYASGKLVLGLTRGNGKLGKDITDKVALLVPNTIDTTYPFMQITGEVVSKAFMENSRNYTAGALNTKSIEEFKEKVKVAQTKFIAYGIQTNKDTTGIFNFYTQDMEFLSNLAFDVVTKVDWSEYPTDGKVIRIDSNAVFKELGYTSKHPRGAYAFKERTKPVTTKLLDVEWQTGKSGKVTPVAILKPVVIGEANVSRATLNNMAYIDALNLEIGCMVEVIRSGEIIPCIVGRAD